MTRFLEQDDAKIVEVAATCLGLVGDLRSASSLAKLLRHADDAVVGAAEHALWSIGFRAGEPFAREALADIARQIASGHHENVIPLLTALIVEAPAYAEAHHQRGQAHYLEGCHEPALTDARRALELNPYHFAAMALEGHCLSGLGRGEEALAVYQRTLALHPRMAGISVSIQMLLDWTAREARRRGS